MNSNQGYGCFTHPLIICLVSAPAHSYLLLQLSDNFNLTTFVENCSILHFDFHVTSSTGWVGLGFNNKSADMDGADIFMGGWAPEKGIYFEDYHVLPNSGNISPIPDSSKEEWTILKSDNLYGNTTRLLAYRNLNVSNEMEDIQLKNEPIYLIWAYSDWSDNLASRHTHRGSIQVNLLTESAAECGFEAPNGCPPTGNDLIEHPTSCELYFVCINGNAYEQECLEGLYFNPTIKACDYPENVNCTKPLPESPPEGVSFHPYPGNCSLYIICAEGVPFVGSTLRKFVLMLMN